MTRRPGERETGYVGKGFAVGGCLALMVLAATVMLAFGGGDHASQSSAKSSSPVPPYERLVEQFNYDASAPLAMRTRQVRNRTGARVRDLSFASPLRGRVTAYLIEPRRRGRFPGVLFQHPHPGDRSYFLEEAVVLARHGVVSLLVNSPFATPPYPQLVTYHQRDADVLRRSIIELRRGLDVLAARRNVRRQRLGFVGEAYGSSMGGVLAGVDRRVRASTLVTALFSREAFWNGPHPAAVAARSVTPSDQWEGFIEAITPLDAVHYLPHTASSVLFQLHRDDPYTPPADAGRYARLVPVSLRTLRWYRSGAIARQRTDRAAWLLARLR